MNKRLIFYTDLTGQYELCRDWTNDSFIPMVGDLVDLNSFELSNTKNNHENKDKLFKVVKRLIEPGKITIYVTEVCIYLFRHEILTL